MASGGMGQEERDESVKTDAAQKTVSFDIPLPDGYDAEDARVWFESITEALSAITADADRDVSFQRTWRAMGELGLGEDLGKVLDA